MLIFWQCTRRVDIHALAKKRPITHVMCVMGLVLFGRTARSGAWASLRIIVTIVVASVTSNAKSGIKSHDTRQLYLIIPLALEVPRIRCWSLKIRRTSRYMPGPIKHVMVRAQTFTYTHRPIQHGTIVLLEICV